MLQVALFALLCAASARARSISGGCQLDLNLQLPKQKDPVYLVKGAKGLLLAMPSEGSIHLDKQQELVLACTGGKNTLKSSGQEVTVANCAGGQTLRLGAKGSEALDLACNQRSSASLLVTKTPCHKDSVIVQSGFQVGKEWFPLIDSCHDMANSHTHWSRHTLYGSRLSGKVIQSNRPGFSRGDKQLYKGFKPDESYQQGHQEAVFEKLFGKKMVSKYLNQGESLFLARGHLSPDADFLYSSWQMLTYFFVNAAPQWQSINAGNWLAVENNARKLAINLGADLEDVTGTHGRLELADEKGKPRPVLLEGSRLPVPEYYWKALARDGSCVVLVATNNPFLTRPPEPLCPDVCAKAGWPAHHDLHKGYVYCCEYKAFKQAVPSAPQLDCKSLLRFK